MKKNIWKSDCRLLARANADWLGGCIWRAADNAPISSRESVQDGLQALAEKNLSQIERLALAGSKVEGFELFSKTRGHLEIRFLFEQPAEVESSISENGDPLQASYEEIWDRVRCAREDQVYPMEYPENRFGDLTSKISAARGTYPSIFADSLRSHQSLLSDMWFDGSIASNTDVSAPAARDDESAISESERNEAAKAWDQLGAEALACYAPFHFYDDESWGIYVHDRRLRAFAHHISHLCGLRTAPDLQRAERIVHIFVLDHELFHAQVEIETFAVELENAVPLYKASFQNVYSSPKVEGPIEELLAEHAAHAALDLHTQGIADTDDGSSRRKPSSKSSAVAAIVRQLRKASRGAPPGYNRWEEGNRDDIRYDLWLSLIEAPSSFNSAKYRDRDPLARPLRHAVAALIPLRYISALVIDEAVHRLFQHRVVAKKLKEHGFGVKRRRGSHETWRHQDGRQVIITAKSVSAGVARQAFRVMDMTADEYRVWCSSGGFGGAVPAAG